MAKTGKLFSEAIVSAFFYHSSSVVLSKINFVRFLTVLDGPVLPVFALKFSQFVKYTFVKFVFPSSMPLTSALFFNKYAWVLLKKIKIYIAGRDSQPWVTVPFPSSARYGFSHFPLKHKWSKKSTRYSTHYSYNRKLMLQDSKIPLETHFNVYFIFIHFFIFQNIIIVL